MPSSGWNGKYRGQGNGGFAGEIDYFLMGEALSHGYATASTDTGHSGSAIDASWALMHPEKVIDFGYRGIHEMSVRAKAIIQAFYSKGPQHSYFGSCSNGGRQALMEAQRFPEDYDGIVAGAPANFWTHLVTNAMWDARATTLDAASYIPAAKLPVISAAVLAACDAQDGIADGILNDPRQCRFDPATLRCKGAESEACLTGAQVGTLKALYAGAHTAAGEQVFPGFLPGAELGPGGWGLWITGSAPGKSLLFAFGVGYFTNFVYQRADWNYKTFQVDEGLKQADAKTAHALNATDATLKAFRARGGKLILYHGWNDPAISALNTINYYENVRAAAGPQGADSFVRLYMVPGMQHCEGGPGTDSFGQFASAKPYDAQHDIHLAVEQWVEKGAAPGRIVASKYAEEASARRVKMTRPLCPYPQVAKYKGSGDTNDAGSFECVAGGK